MTYLATLFKTVFSEFVHDVNKIIAEPSTPQETKGYCEGQHEFKQHIGGVSILGGFAKASVWNVTENGIPVTKTVMSCSKCGEKKVATLH